jgi:putative protease
VSASDRAKPRRPEILAPAGSQEALAAALAAGADAVYFGLDEGFNARARAANFSRDKLGEVVAQIHRAGARAYVTLNTLVFEGELEQAEDLLRAIARSGVDALIVQDPAIALLARAICPTLELHASTQMTICNADAARFAAMLGCNRVVVPRELSVAEIRRFRAETDLELEVFVHGALCVSWSGQCLTSETWGGRSANRGQCAQSCRMPYDLILDGELRPLPDLAYLLSPKDLAGVRAIPALAELGVEGLKIEGRQKGAPYVSTAVGGYRRWLDAILAGAPDAEDHERLAIDLRAMGSAYTRGFSDGFLAGSDHQTLVEGRFPKHRGHSLGIVSAVQGDTVEIAREGSARPWTGARALPSRSSPRGERSSPLPGLDPAGVAPPELRAGMGVVFDDDHPETDEVGGPLWRVAANARGWRVQLAPSHPGLSRIRVGQRVWLTSDPSIVADLSAPPGRHPLTLQVRGRHGAKLQVTARSGELVCEVESDSALSPAAGEGLTAALIREKLGAVGGTALRLESLLVDELESGLHLPVSELKRMRREFVATLEERIAAGPRRAIDPTPALSRVHAQLAEASVARGAAPTTTLELVPLCREPEQLEAAIDQGVREVELDWMELAGLSRAVARAREAGLRVVVATLRVTKPGERRFDERLLDLAPDGILVRHFGALELFAALPSESRPVLHGDFSLNVTNSLTAKLLLGRGLSTITPSHDLDAQQLRALLTAIDSSQVTLTLHVRMPTFHTEHCVYAHLLSEGRDYRSCGRPCERHRVALRDRLGFEHPVIVDAGCRNTVFNGTLQTAAGVLAAARDRGARRFRVEFVRESAAEVTDALAAYRALLDGAIDVTELRRRLRVELRVGVLPGSGATGDR